MTFNEWEYLEIVHGRFVRYLAERYKNGETLVIAGLCDETLDRSGKLLGEVRAIARSFPPAGRAGT